MVDCEGVSLASSCTKLPHSRSAEISKTPPPGAGPKGGGKMLAIRVHMLDDNITLFQVQAKAIGRVLFEQVCKQLHLLEADYFGLEYQDHSGIRYWLDLEKQLSRQVGLSLVEPLLHFCVKFYTPDPAQLEEEFTRYLFCLQIKRDLAQGHLQCNDNTAALMASYIVQAECGDYSADDYPDHTYLSSYKFVQHQDRELEKKIMDNHKKHVGQSPAEADLNLLETARRCELYGMKMHPAKDHEGVPLNLAVAHMGLAVFQNYAKIYTFSWAKVRKISFKRKKFLIKLHPDGYGYYKDVVEFFFESRNECKNLWKKCVENHGFFRCNAVKRVPRQRTRVLSRGSSFRYSGKTQKQMVEFVRENYVKRQNFQRNSGLTRSQSFRQSSSVHSSVATNVGGSISARPLIPLGDNSIVSVSCGSMVHVGVEEGSQSRTFQPTMTNSQTTVHRRTSPEDHHTITSGLRSYNTTSSQTDIVDLIETSTIEEQPSYSWQRSASAKELRKAPSDASYEPPPRERNFIIAGSKTPSFDREAETKVYSSSYPGTTSSLSTESADELEPGGSVLVIDTGSSREFSHDDLSHDSYELLDRENYHNFVHSRSCSIGSSGDNMLDLNDDELFIMDEIVKEDVEKRLGYVEPKYRNMAFNEFNEKCKQGIARFREMNAVEFMEYEAKCKPGVVIGYDEPDVHYPVERTKSEPFVSDFWKVAKQHRKLYHQKSFDYTPTESMDSEERSVTSKSTVDLPYATLKRQQVNGTVQCFECRSPVSPRKDETSPAEFDRKGVIAQDRLTKTKHDSDLNSHDSGLSLSLVGESIDDLADRHNQYLKPNDQRYMKELKPSLKKEVFKFSSEDGYRNKNLLIKSKAQSADSGLKKGGSFDRNPPVEVIKIPSQDGEGIVICSTDDKNISLDTSDPDVIIVEYHSKRKRAFQKRSSSDGKGSFDKDKRMGSLDSATPDAKSRDKKFKEWRSESSSSCDVPASDFKRERFSKEVKTSIEGKVVRETREEKELKKQRSEEIEKKKTEELRKQKSEELTRQKSEDLQKKIERRQEVIDALKKKHEDLNKIEIIKVGKDDSKKKGFSRLSPKPVVQKQEKVIELSPKPEHRDIEKIVMEVPVEINATKSQLRECSEEWSRMEQDKRRSLSPIKDAEGPHESTSPLPDVFPSPVKLKSPVEKPKISTKPKIVEAPKTSSDTLPKEKPSVLENLEVAQTANEPEQMNDGGNKASGGKTDVVVDSSKLTSPELVWKKFDNGVLNDSSMNAKNSNYSNNVTSSPLATKLNGSILPNGSSESHEVDMASDRSETLKSDLLEKEAKKKRNTLDKAYFIGKELLMTERTYKRDLEMINVYAREAFSPFLDESNYMSQLLNLIDPIDDFHSLLLKDMEHHFSIVENRLTYETRLADIFCNIAQQIHVYDEYIDSVKTVLLTLASELAQPNFEAAYANFEKNKICYLPLSLFLLKPLQRILHYSSLLDRVVEHLISVNGDGTDFGKAKSDFSNLNKKVYKVLADSENYVQLIELSRDLVCFEGKLIDDDRIFIRQGCLTKFSQKKGYQQRMFFLLSDMLLYCNLVGHKFKVHGQLPLRSLTLEEREDSPSPNSFTMYSEKRAFTVCGSSHDEKNKWLKDISTAVEVTKRDSSPSKTFFSLKCSSSSDDVNEKEKHSNDVTPQRSNTTVHVCWHRNTSVSLSDHINAAQNQLSGYLLRKFKSSNGWQKLWVVFTNFCLFFYKTFQDEAPLASLPLLGYSVTVPTSTDNITKDFVFKLMFKSHVYFFRAESQYTFDRWMEVIESATLHSQKIHDVPSNNNIC